MTIGCFGLPCALPSMASSAVGSSQCQRVRSVTLLSIIYIYINISQSGGQQKTAPEQTT